MIDEIKVKLMPDGVTWHVYTRRQYADETWASYDKYYDSLAEIKLEDFYREAIDGFQRARTAVIKRH